ncbi:uncharacterized protein LOC129972777 [Argiope bruennichi]|uniref:Uncharacterized protein n=2 Tax=Araneidae TaxID=6913 RepID=A0A8T0F8J3_ARGBR|nr:uncharacterized protein LOC129972777 [Argiope bruennichi]KAF8787517.1 hypothetical protein HNY73_009104 [Argiope bruennichi]
MGLPWKLLILVAIAIAVLCQLEVTQNKWVVSKSLSLKATVDDTFSFMTSLDYVDKWFPFVSRVRQADGRPLGVGKKLFAVYDIPAYGEYQMLYRVVEYKKGKLIVVEGDNLLKPRIEFGFAKVKESVCKLTITISFRRMSYFFQYTFAPVLNFLVNQKLQHALFLLKSVFPY